MESGDGGGYRPTAMPAARALTMQSSKEVMTVRKLALLGAVAALWLFVAAIPVFADGGPHVMTTNNGTTGLTADSCAGCHRAHTASAAGLLNTDQPDLCLNCHDGSMATTDVIDGVQYTSTAKGTPVLGALRGGGFQYALIDSSNAARLSYASSRGVSNVGHIQPLTTAQAVTSTHGGTGGIYSAGWGTGTVWGNGAVNSGTGATVTMECASCHNPHGNGKYRILQTSPALTATLGAYKVTNSSGVEVQDTTTPGTHNYTIKPATDGTNANGSAANIVTSASGDYWRYHWDPTGVASWTQAPVPPATTPAAPPADPMNTGWNSLTASYVSTSTATPPVTKTNYVVAYPVNAAGIAAYNTQLAAYGINDPVTGAASISALSNKGGLMTAWCIQCHTRYNGNNAVIGTAPNQSSSASSLTDNSGGDLTFMFKHGTTRIGCEQCHVSHGSNALQTGTNSITYTDPNNKVPARVSGAGPLGNQTSGDSRLLKVDNRGTCQLCHDPTGTVTAGAYTGPLPVPGN
jgi:predicted CXXCH cytochrome family protein